MSLNIKIKWKTLSEICDIAISNVDKKSKKNQATVKLCNFTDVYNNWQISQNDTKSFMSATASNNAINKFTLKEGQVAITKDSETRSDIGMSTYIAENLDNTVLGYHCALLTPDPTVLDGGYLNAYLSSYLGRKYFSNQASGSGQRYTLTLDSIGSVKIPILDISYQKKLGKIFLNIDSKISNSNAISKELESMAKTIYDYWFLQFEFPDKDGKPYKSNGGKMVWNDQLKQEIPEGWEVAVINNILGKYPKTKTVESKNYNQGTKYPIIDQSKDSYICGYTNDEEKVLKLSNAIVFGDHSNKSKYVNFPFARGADGTQIISSNNLRLPNYLLYQEIISLPEIEKGYSRHFKFLKMQNIIIPSLNISKKYMDLVDDMLNKQKQIILENKQLKSLRDFLLPLLMNGQVTIES